MATALCSTPAFRLHLLHSVSSPRIILESKSSCLILLTLLSYPLKDAPLGNFILKVKLKQKIRLKPRLLMRSGRAEDVRHQLLKSRSHDDPEVSRCVLLHGWTCFTFKNAACWWWWGVFPFNNKKKISKARDFHGNSESES